MNIKMISTAANKIRAEQAGDWWLFPHNGNGIVVHVIDGLPPESQLAIAIHELVEAYLCGKHGVDENAVVAWDERYEQDRKDGKHGPAEEPGDDPGAPYLEEHRAATRVEREVCQALGLSWKEHERLLLEWEGGHLRMESPGPLPAESPEPPPQHVPD